MKTTFVRWACCALVLTFAAGCGPGYGNPPPSNESGVRGVNVENCTVYDPAFGQEGMQFTVFSKHEAEGWVPRGQLQQLNAGEPCGTYAIPIPFDQPGTWQVRAIAVIVGENCDSYTGQDVSGCSYVRESLYEQNPEGPMAPPFILQ